MSDQQDARMTTHTPPRPYDITEAFETFFWRHDLDSPSGVLCVTWLDAALAHVLGKKLVDEGKPLGDLLAGAVVEQNRCWGNRV